MGDLLRDYELLKFLIDEAEKRMELSYLRFQDQPVFHSFFYLETINRQQLNYVLARTEFQFPSHQITSLNK